MSQRIVLTREEIFEKLKSVVVDALGVDEDEVVDTARISEDLGAESVDHLDIIFRLEKTFGVQMPRSAATWDEIEPRRSLLRKLGPNFTAEQYAALKSTNPHLFESPTIGAICGWLESRLPYLPPRTTLDVSSVK